MKTKIKYFLDILHSSFWFLPIIIIFAALTLAFGLLRIDSLYPYMPESGFLLFILSGGAESARTVLSTIAGAMLAMATTVFSITLVVLTLASSQFGSRLLRNFMYDRLNQIVLGTFISTFVFCLVILKAVHSENDLVFVPNFSILFAEILTLGNIILLIIFIHHTSVSIQADKVISDISHQLNKEVQEQFHFNNQNKPFNEVENYLNEKQHYIFRKEVVNRNSGYLQAIDYPSLIEIADTYDLLIELESRPGDFLVNGIQLVLINGKSDIDDEIAKKIHNSFIIGKIRNPSQDVEFAIHQLVEIAARALSPGVNDPYTALTCIDHLTVTLSYLAQINFPGSFRYNSNDHVRLQVKILTFDGAMNAGFNQIRQYGQSSPTILIRLMERIYFIYLLAQHEPQKTAALKHAHMVMNAGQENIKEKSDLNDLNERYEKFKINFKA